MKYDLEFNEIVEGLTELPCGWFQGDKFPKAMYICASKATGKIMLCTLAESGNLVYLPGIPDRESEATIMTFSSVSKMPVWFKNQKYRFILAFNPYNIVNNSDNPDETSVRCYKSALISAQISRNRDKQRAGCV